MPHRSQNKTFRQRTEHRQLLARLAAHERERERLRSSDHPPHDLEPRLVGLQRKIDRVRRTAKMPQLPWLEINRQDRALRRRLSS